MIDRANILELIGKGKRKYHSCVITSYSIDLDFFEKLVLPGLKGAGVLNINLLVDAGMLEKYLGMHLSNNTEKSGIRYSITPVDLNGAFHPKMLFLAGKSTGYLAVGSGNITSSGLLYNDEVWSSFYTSEKLTDARPIFKKAWEYILSLKESHCYNINRDKIDWILSHSPWIQSLNTINSTVFSKDGFDYKFISTQKDRSLYHEVIGQLPKHPKSIKVIAPYYNKSGAFLQGLIDDLNPLKIHCVVDKTTGKLPVDFESSLCQYSDWTDVVKNDENKTIGRLHAKIIQIEYQKETFFILGSANATLEAYGIGNSKYRNEEAVISIKSTPSRDFLKELGIQIPVKGTFELQSVQSNENQDFEFGDGLLKLKYVELDNESLTIYLLKKLTAPAILKTFDRANEVLEEIEVSHSSELIEATLGIIRNVFKVAFFSQDKTCRISTFGLVQNLGLLKGSNPDDRMIQLQKYLDLDILDTSNYVSLLTFFDRQQFFTEKNASLSPISNKKKEDADDDGQIISEKEYNRNADLVYEEFHTKEMMTTAFEKLLDVLRIRDEPEELSSSTEERALEAGEDGIDDDTISESSFRFVNSSIGLRLSRKIKKTIKDIGNLIHKRNIKNIPQDDRTLNALFIGFHILLHFWDEEYITELAEIRICYKDLQELAKLEKKFKLERLGSQIDSRNNEVSYHIKCSLLKDLGIHLEDSNMTFNVANNKVEKHPIVTDKTIHNYTSKNWLFDFINLGLSQFILKMKAPGSEIEMNKSQKWKLLILSNQLINNIKWNKKVVWKDLLLLNIYDVLGLQELISSGFNTHNELIDLEFCNKYLDFKNRLDDNEVKRYPVNLKLEGSIIYSETMGFGCVRKALKDFKMEFYSPFHNKNVKEDEQGKFKVVYISQQVRVFN